MSDGRDRTPVVSASGVIAHAVKPKWLAMLALVLAVAAIFAALAQWQISSAIASLERANQNSISDASTPLGDHLKPQTSLYERSIGASVTFEGVLDPADVEVLPKRLQGMTDGWWIIGRVHVSDDHAGLVGDAADAASLPGLAVAVAWASDGATATAAAATLREQLATGAQEATTFSGTLEYGQAPAAPDGGRDPLGLEQMSPAYLVNRWATPSPSAYSAYVTLNSGVELPAGTEAIQRQLVNAGGQLNWLNIFYAAEWIIFALFAFYLWWRLVRDDYARTRVIAPSQAELEAEIRRERLRALRDAHGIAAPRNARDRSAAHTDS